jgi:DNA-binding CsgD family transcriptional regulator
VLFVANPAIGLMRWTASPSFREIFERFVAEGWAQRDPRMGRILAARHAGFLTDDDLFTAEELQHDECYVNFKRPHGVGWGAGMAAPLPTGDILGIGMERDHDRGPMERIFIQKLDELRPHLARSAFISARLQLERAQAAAEMLSVLGLPALLLGARGAVVAANGLIEALTDLVRWRAQDRVSLADASADAMLRAALSRLDSGGPVTPRSFAVRDSEGTAAMVAHLVPIRGAALDIFSRCEGVLVLTPATAPQAPPIELIQSLFDLTAAEARVARGLAAGDSLDDIAAAGGVSRNTIRSQLRGALEKTGCGRQAELVALLGGIMPRFIDPKM